VPGPPLSPETIATVRAALLAFFDASARPLPWRQSGEPYAIWVSEIMAQQTRIDTVIPYFERWLARFPDIATLAESPLDDVLKLWEGLGYYSRARNLHAAARLVRERHAGTLPGEYDALRALPGIGDYTAGAVASIAFGARMPVVDGNVRRVLARLLDEPAPGPKRLRSVAGALVPADRPGHFNQALMEFGSRICTPRAPRCDECPLRDVCAARIAGTQLDRPRRKPKKTVASYDVVTVILRAPDGRVMLMRRPDPGLLAGMWSFPGIEPTAGLGLHDTAREFAMALAPNVRPHTEPVSIGVVEHTFSHRRERYHCFIVDVPAADPDDVGRTWIGADRGDIALPRAQQKIHALAVATRPRHVPG
jgi:A/G-specific adenine glycosylase